ncbi:MAG: YDG domain-containing protein, partial [Lachnospiraceae bacterium]|nr:YDG domain-containing protein [Lachnospiraceae bacterium]
GSIKDLEDVRLYIGGDTFTYNSYGSINTDTGTAFVYRNVGEIIMSLRGITAPTSYYAARNTEGHSAAQVGNSLSNATSTGSLVDTGYYLQWGDRNGGANAISIPIGGSYKIETSEQFTTRQELTWSAGAGTGSLQSVEIDNVDNKISVSYYASDDVTVGELIAGLKYTLPFDPAFVVADDNNAVMGLTAPLESADGGTIYIREDVSLALRTYDLEVTKLFKLAAPTALPATSPSSIATVKLGDKITLLSNHPNADILYGIGVMLPDLPYNAADGITVTGTAGGAFTVNAQAVMKDDSLLESGIATFTYRIADKIQTTVTVTSPDDIIYGETLDDPIATADEGASTFTFRYTGTMENETPYDSAEKPLNPGEYTVTATLVSNTHMGSDSEDFTISPKPLTWNADGTVASRSFISGSTAATIATAPTLNGVIGADTVTVKNGTVSFVNANVGTRAVTAAGFGIAGDDSWKYTAPSAQPSFADGEITASNFTPLKDTHFTATELDPEGQTDSDFVIYATSGYLVSKNLNEADGWQTSLTWSVNTNNGKAEFYVKDTATGDISEMASVAYKIDINEPVPPSIPEKPSPSVPVSPSIPETPQPSPPITDTESETYAPIGQVAAGNVLITNLQPSPTPSNTPSNDPANPPNNDPETLPTLPGGESLEELEDLGEQDGDETNGDPPITPAPAADFPDGDTKTSISIPWLRIGVISALVVPAMGVPTLIMLKRRGFIKWKK